MKDRAYWLLNYIFKFHGNACFSRCSEFHEFSMPWYICFPSTLCVIYFRLAFVRALLYYFRIICTVLHFVFRLLPSFFIHWKPFQPAFELLFGLSWRKEKQLLQNYCSFSFTAAENKNKENKTVCCSVSFFKTKGKRRSALEW